MIPPKRFDIFPPDWGMLRRSRRVRIFLLTRAIINCNIINNSLVKFHDSIEPFYTSAIKNTGVQYSTVLTVLTSISANGEEIYWLALLYEYTSWPLAGWVQFAAAVCVRTLRSAAAAGGIGNIGNLLRVG